MPLWLAIPFGGLKLDMVPIKMPFAAFQYAANDNEMYKPRKM